MNILAALLCIASVTIFFLAGKYLCGMNEDNKEK